MKRNVIKNIFKWGSLFCFFIASIIILIESGLDGTTSGNQSNTITDPIHGAMEDSHDEETIKELTDFDVTLEDENDDNIYNVGETLTYVVTYNPADASYKEIDVLYDEEYLNIENTSIHLLKQGDTEITFKSNRYENLSKTLQISIKNVEVEEIIFAISSYTMDVGETFTNEVTITPTNATFKELTYSSSNPEVATIDKTLGTVTALKEGTTTITAKSSNNVKNSFIITVNKLEDTKIPITHIELDDIEIYEGQTKTIKGKFYPTNGTFTFNDLNIESDENLKSYLTITNNKVDNINGTFSLTLKAKSAFETNINSEIILSYSKLEPLKVNVSLNKKSNLSIDNIDLTKINNETKILNKNYINYGVSNNLIQNVNCDKINITIPYKSDVTSYTYKYNLNNFVIEYDSKLFKQTKNNYQNLSFEVIDPNLIVENKEYIFTYYPNNLSEEYITFKFKFINHEESVFIESINLKYLNENSITNLGNKGTYSNLFSYTIETNIESSLSDSKINIEILSGEENIQFLYTDDEITGLKTINSGNVSLKITSAYETSINYLTPIEKIYDLQIIDNPNYVKLITNNKTYFNEEIPSSLTLNKGETINLKLEVYNKTVLNSKTYLNLLDDNSLISVKNNDSSISYNTTSNSITGIRKVDEIPIVTISSNLYPSIQYDFEINVNYIEIDKESFKFNFTLDEAPNDYNKPKNNDFSKVAIGTIFTINPIINTDATNKELGYISSNNSILQVNYYTGLCTALKPGKVKLTAISISDPSIKFDTFINVVNTTSPFTIKSEDINALEFNIIKNGENIEYYDIKLDYGLSYKLNITPLFESSSNSINYSYENLKEEIKTTSDVISVDKNGNLTTKDVGEEWLKITYGDDSTINQYSSFIHFNVSRNMRFTFSQLSMLIRKGLGHFGLFACTSITALVFIFLQFKKDSHKLIAFSISACCGFLLAFLSELIQYFTPGRGPSWSDVLIDFSGYLSVIIIGLLIILIIFIYRMIKKKNIKNN